MPEEAKKKPAKRQRMTKHFLDFRSRARSELWRADPGKDHKTHATWTARIKELQENSDMTESQATILASKDYRRLYHLFHKYDVREYDLNPGSHPAIRHFGENANATVTPGDEVEVIIEDRELSYRENLNWAMDAAGGNDLTGAAPLTCPNKSAWFLYVQALENPKEFLAKIGQIEGKLDSGEDRREVIKSARRSIRELNSMLDTLEFQEEETHGEAQNEDVANRGDEITEEKKEEGQD